MKTLRFRFTLVEVLAVVALVSLLAAIGFGAYSYAMNASRESNTKSASKRGWRAAAPSTDTTRQARRSV